jgi:hypothetical protein
VKHSLLIPSSLPTLSTRSQHGCGHYKKDRHCSDYQPQWILFIHHGSPLNGQAATGTPGPPSTADPPLVFEPDEHSCLGSRDQMWPAQVAQRFRGECREFQS